MGQRHQVYIAVPQKQRNGDKEVKSTAVLGLHHQWLYGKTAIRLLHNMLKYAENAKKNYAYCYFNNHYDLRETQNLLESIYTTDHTYGYYHNVIGFNKDDTYDARVLRNPKCGDNNDGITVIDFTNGKNEMADKPRYCFYTLEGGDSFGIPDLIWSAEDYLLHYYPKFMGKTGSGKEFSVEKETKPILRYLSKFDLLTHADLKRLFPEMMKTYKRHPEVEAMANKLHPKRVIEV
jgi:hypothetical protein